MQFFLCAGILGMVVGERLSHTHAQEPKTAGWIVAASFGQSKKWAEVEIETPLTFTQRKRNVGLLETVVFGGS